MAKIFRRCLLLILLLPTARANNALRAVLADVKCPATKFNVRDGRELAAALERTLRQSPGGEDLCVTWIDRAAPPFAGDSWSAELTDLTARDLLRTVCANAGVFWGFRHGGIALSARALRVTEGFPYIASRGLLCCPDDGKSPLYYPDEVTSSLTTLLPQAVWRPDQLPSLMFMGRNFRMSLIASEDDYPAVREAVKPGIAWSELHRVLISATWIAVPNSTAGESGSPGDGTELRRLIQESKVRVRNHQTVLTLSGMNAVVEAVDAVMYPTSFDVAEEKMNVSTGSGAFLGPTKFDTRKAGPIHNVSPAVHSDSTTILLRLLPEWCQLVGWQTPGVTSAHQVLLSNPRFRSLNLTTTLSIRDNGEHVQELGRDPVSGDLILLHLHVRLLTADGTPRNPR